MEGLTPIALKPSRWALWLHRSAVLLVVLAVISCGFNSLLKVGLLLLLLSLAWRQEQFLCDRAVESMGIEQGQWWIQRATQKIAVQRSGEVVVLPWLIVLPLRRVDSHQDCSLALWPDSVCKDDARRLRVFLRYGAQD